VRQADFNSFSGQMLPSIGKLRSGAQVGLPLGSQSALHYRCIQNPYQNPQIFYKMFSAARFWVLNLHNFLLNEAAGAPSLSSNVSRIHLS
jgi:hypothetical protein